MTRYLFEHLDMLGERIAHAPSLIVFVNLNGTLPPAAERLEQNELPPNVRQTLRSLARLENAEVAVFSNKRLADLQAYVALPDVCYAGNNGLEISTPESTFVEPAALALQGNLCDLEAELARKLQSIGGVRIENRGLSLGVHYDQVGEGDREEVRRRLHAALANSSHPFVLNQAEYIYDIRPRVYWSKADAVRWIRDQTGRQEALAIYVAGDASDEDAFDALKDGITVRMGCTPETAAQYHVNEPQEVLEFLAWLANVLVDKFLAEPRPARV